MRVAARLRSQTRGRSQGRYQPSVVAPTWRSPGTSRTRAGLLSPPRGCLSPSALWRLALSDATAQRGPGRHLGWRPTNSETGPSTWVPSSSSAGPAGRAADDQGGSRRDELAIAPGEVNRLSEQALVDAGEFTALAALVLRIGDVLFGCWRARAGTRDAFTWWWALASQSVERFSTATQLPPKLAVPGELEDAVAEHNLLGRDPRERQYPTAPGTSRGPILARLDNTAPWVMQLAHDVHG